MIEAAQIPKRLVLITPLSLRSSTAADAAYGLAHALAGGTVVLDNPDHPLRREGLLVQAGVRMTGAAGRPFIHDPLDGVSAAATLGAAAEAGIDLAHAGPLRVFCNH